MSKISLFRSAASLAPPPRTPERQKLADAIERHRAAVEAEANVRAAQDCAASAWHHADAAITAAKAALQEAQDAEPRRMVERMLAGGGPGEGEEIRLAQAALDKAEEDQRGATVADKLLVTELEKTQSEIRWAELGLTKAVGDVLRAAPENAAAIALMQAARARFEDAFAVVSTIESAGGSEQNDAGGKVSKLEEPLLQNLVTPDVKKWRAAIEALHHDADAPLPAADELN